jgi:hypothetical protein
MKPIFTIHAGEYLVGSHIEETYKRARVWLPSKDTGIDLLVTNEHLDLTVSLQVKFSKDFLGNKVGASALLQTGIKAGGWWTFNYDKIKNSPANLWVLVLYRFSHRDFDFVIISPSQLLECYENLGHKSGIIQSYVWVTENGECWETRGLKKAEQESIAVGTFNEKIRSLSEFLNNWQPLLVKIGLDTS